MRARRRAPRREIRTHGVTALLASHAEIQRLKRGGHTPSIHGNKIWRSCFALIDYLHRHPIPPGSKVMDVGCGWGLTGIYLAKRYGAQVVAIDADDDVEPYLAVHAEANGVDVTFRQQRFQQITTAELKGVHTLVGSDICFWDELTGPLYNLVRRALRAGVSQVLIADPGRPPFWDLAERCEQHLDAEVIEKRISHPVKTSKQLLLVRG